MTLAGHQLRGDAVGVEKGLTLQGLRSGRGPACSGSLRCALADDGWLVDVMLCDGDARDVCEFRATRKYRAAWALRVMMLWPGGIA